MKSLQEYHVRIFKIYRIRNYAKIQFNSFMCKLKNSSDYFSRYRVDKCSLKNIFLFPRTRKTEIFQKKESPHTEAIKFHDTLSPHVTRTPLTHLPPAPGTPRSFLKAVKFFKFTTLFQKKL